MDPDLESVLPLPILDHYYSSSVVAIARYSAHANKDDRLQGAGPRLVDRQLPGPFSAAGEVDEIYKTGSQIQP